jgi:hypothetical protein
MNSESRAHVRTILIVVVSVLIVGADLALKLFHSSVSEAEDKVFARLGISSNVRFVLLLAVGILGAVFWLRRISPFRRRI